MTDASEARGLLVYRYVLLPTLVSAYAFTMHWSYTTVILEQFRYRGYSYVETQFLNHAVVVSIATFAAWFLPLKANKPSAVVLWILYIVAVAPSILMAPYVGILSTADSIWSGVGFGLAFVGVVVLVGRTGPTSPLTSRMSASAFWAVVSIYSMAAYGYLAASQGLSFNYLSVLDVYDVRSDYAESLGRAALLGYVVSTQANVVNPLILAKGLLERRPILIAVAVGGQLLLYASTGFKTMLLSIPAVILVYLLLRRPRFPYLASFLVGAVATVLISAAADRASGGIIWSSLFSRRFLFTPARLTSTYIDFYQDRPKHLWSHLLSPLVESDYVRGPSRTVAIYVFGSPDSSLNANLFADGFANLGWWGVIVAAGLLTAYLRLLDRAAIGLPVVVPGLVVVMPAVTLSNTSLVTSMLSHGLLAALLLSMLAPADGWKATTRIADRRRKSASYSALRKPSRPIRNDRYRAVR